MFEKKYQSVVSILASRFPKFFELVFPYRKIIKYLISGGLAALSAFSSLYFLTEIIGLWYVLSSAIGSVAGLVVSFCFQKFWTFRDKGLGRIKSQVFFYITVLIVNSLLNAGGIFVLVHFLFINYLIAQIILIAAIAFGNFSVFNKFIFKRV